MTGGGRTGEVGPQGRVRRRRDAGLETQYSVTENPSRVEHEVSVTRGLACRTLLPLIAMLGVHGEPWKGWLVVARAVCPGHVPDRGDRLPTDSSTPRGMTKMT